MMYGMMYLKRCRKCNQPIQTFQYLIRRTQHLCSGLIHPARRQDEIGTCHVFVTDWKILQRRHVWSSISRVAYEMHVAWSKHHLDYDSQQEAKK
jgi:hypothetical protein